MPHSLNYMLHSLQVTPSNAMLMTGSWCVFYHIVLSNEKIMNKECVFTIRINYSCASQNLGEWWKKQKRLVWLVAGFLIWVSVVSSNKYFCYFLNGINGIFLWFLVGGCQKHVLLFHPLVNSRSTFFYFKAVPGVLKGKQAGGLKLKI